MSKSGVIGAEEALESGVSLTKKAGKGIAKSASDTAKAATSQLGITTASDQDTKDFVKDLYGQGSKKQLTTNNQNSQNTSAQSSSQKTSDDAGSLKSPEEQQKLAEVRTKLQKRHDEVYYQPLINPSKPPEERPAEKVENEKQEEMQELEVKKKEKPPPLAIQRGQTKAERFPGGGG